MLKALSAIEMPLGRDRDVMFAHSAKAPSFMNVAAEAMMTSLRLLQRRKALMPIAFTELGISILESLVHSRNAKSEIISTESGMLILLSASHCSNAHSPMKVKDDGRVTSVSELHRLNVSDSSLTRPSGRDMFCNFSQPENAL